MGPAEAKRMAWMAQSYKCAVCGRADVEVADRHIPDLSFAFAEDHVECRVWCGVCIDMAERCTELDGGSDQDVVLEAIMIILQGDQ